MIGKLKDLTINRDQSQNVTITIGEDFREEFDRLKNTDIVVEIKKASGKRSMDANSYFWHLCGEIAKATSKYSTDGKNEIYREAIRAKGEYTSLIIREDAVKFFIERYKEKGIGWFAEVIDDYIAPPGEFDDVMGDNGRMYKVVHAYNGSSTYDVTSMNKIIDYVVLIANDLGIPTMTDSEKEKLLESWGRKKQEAHQKNT